jgi:high affinity sulfate transporter 1
MTTESMQNSKPSRRLASFIPILSWLPRYNRAWLAADIIAGLTLWGLVVPEGMAYAGIADLPPQAGLYTLVASLLVYALFGSSRHLSVVATSATAALIASTVVALGATTGDMATYQAYAAALVLVIGAVFLVAGLARLGWVTQFLSKPVMDGFIFGLAIFVAVGQLNKLFGVEKGHGNVFQKLFAIIQQLPEANWVAFAVGAAALALLFLLPRWNRKIPAGLVVLFGSIAISVALDLNANYGVEVAGVLPQGLPSVSLPQVSLTTVLEMILPAIGIFLLSYSESLGVAREFAEKHGYEVNPDQELTAHAFANLASGLFGGMIAAGSMSSSAVKEEAGARTQVTNLVTWVVTLVTLLFLTPLFKSLPEAVLAALIIHALWHILTARKLEKIRLVSKTEFWLAVITLAGVLFIDVLEGMIIGLVASTLLVLYQSSRPHIASLGRIPGLSSGYSDLQRHPENSAIPGVLILRLDAPIYYASALTVRGRIKTLVEEAGPSLRAVILDAAGQDSLDITTAEVLKGLIVELKDKGIAYYVAELHLPVKEFGQRTGLIAMIGEDHFFPTLDAAVRFCEQSDQPDKTNSEN